MVATALHRKRLDRLRALGVELVELPSSGKQGLFRLFADAFVDPPRREHFMASTAGRRPIEYDRYLRAECHAGPVQSGGSLAWLAGTRSAARCYRVERDATLPALDILVGSLDEIWATSWPGLFVSFDAGRALVVTLDYERIHCDLRRLTPYR